MALETSILVALDCAILLVLDTLLDGVALISLILGTQGVGGGTLPVTARTLETIIRLSAAHSKLKLRNQVPKLKQHQQVVESESAIINACAWKV